MRKLAWVAAPFAGAVFLAVYLLPRALWLFFAAACTLLFVGAIMLRKLRYGLPACLLAAGLAAGFWWCAGYDQVMIRPAEELAGQTLRVTAEVTQWPRQTQYGISVQARLLGEDRLDVAAVVYLDSEWESLQPGDRFQVVAKLTDAGLAMGESDDYYYSVGIRLKAVGYGPVTVTEADMIDLRYLPQWAARWVKQGISAAFSPETAPVVQALATGDKSGLADDFYTALQRCGLAHTVAVSGMHLMFLVGFLNLVLRRRRRTAVVSVVVIVFFTLLVGATPSVVRAAITQILLLLAPLLGRDYDPVTALSLSLMLLLLHNPYAAASVGLQLSFASVAGILLVSERLRKFLCQKAGVARSKERSLRAFGKRVLEWVFSLLSVSLGAMLFTVPLTALHFGTVSLLAPVANLLALWAVTGAFLFGLAAGILGMITPPVGAAVGIPAALCVRYLQALAPGLAKLPFLSLPVRSDLLVLWLVFAYALLGLNLLWRGAGKRRPRLSAAIAAGALIVAIAVNAASFSVGSMTVSALDVGQGQSILLRLGDTCALVDCGGNARENAGDIAANFLEEIGRRKLDVLILTHYHADHANGIPRLLERVAVKQLFLPDVEEDDPLRQAILSQAEERGIEVRFVRTDTTLQAGEGLRLNLYPPLGDGGSNELGLTVVATAGQYDALITGDMNDQVEQLLLEHTILPDIELLVVGHHGSKYATSQELLEWTRPELAIISVGRNSYGHPTEETLERLREIGAEVYRTDWNGTVTVRVGNAA